MISKNGAATINSALPSTLPKVTLAKDKAKPNTMIPKASSNAATGKIVDVTGPFARN